MAEEREKNKRRKAGFRKIRISINKNTRQNYEGNGKETVGSKSEKKKWKVELK